MGVQRWHIHLFLSAYVRKSLEKIVEDLLSEVNSKEDAYRVIGKCASMGLMDEYFKLYMSPYNDKVYYAIAPRYIQEGAVSEIPGLEQ